MFPTRIISSHCLASRLFSLRVARPANYVFRAGQFASLALPARPEEESPEPFIARPYSFVNAPIAEALEFLIAEVEHGALTSRLAQLKAGDEIFLGEPQGFFSTDALPNAESPSTLWCVATGTGIAPYLSMLRTSALWEKFEHIVVARGARHDEECVGQEVWNEIAAARPGRLTVIDCVTRSENPSSGALRMRLTTALETGKLEARAGRDIDPENSRILLCGNTSMIEDMMTLLKARGLRKNRPKTPGQIATEKYF
jgi:ferredoxin--NADP+ reductase